MRSIVMISASVLLLATTACQRKAEPAQPDGQAAAVDQPSLWSIEVLSDGKTVSRADICADQSVRAGFVRPAPEVGGRPCVKVKGEDRPDGTYSGLCRADDQLYRVGSTTMGDRASDFTVEMVVARQDAKSPTFEQVRRYRRLGSCPSGWHVGDSAAPGDKELLDTIKGVRRPMPPTGG